MPTDTAGVLSETRTVDLNTPSDHYELDETLENQENPLYEGVGGNNEFI